MSTAYTVTHYENFPVASVLLPPAMRRPIQIVYRFARSADDFADEGDMPPAQRLALLEGYRAELGRIATGQTPHTLLFRDLQQDVIQRHAVPLALFTDLLDAFSQDVTTQRYEDFAQLEDYCRRSANPVGRIVLHLAGQPQPAQLAQSDAICTALQLINFWQDIAIDWQKQRVYLPQADLRRFAVEEQQIADGVCDEAWRALMAFQVDRARELMCRGQPLLASLSGRLQLEIALTVAGGTAILDQLTRVRGDVFRLRPKLGKKHIPSLLFKALTLIWRPSAPPPKS